MEENLRFVHSWQFYIDYAAKHSAIIHLDNCFGTRIATIDGRYDIPIITLKICTTVPVIVRNCNAQ